MKRFIDIQGPFSTDNNGKDIWQTVNIDSPLDAKGSYIYDYKEKYFVKGRPTGFWKDMLLELINHHDFRKILS